MAWSTELEALMPHSVTVKTLSSFSTDGYGVPTWSSGTAVTARVVARQELVRTLEGTEETATTVVYLASTGSINPSDRFVLPDGTTPTLLAVQSFPDEDGTHHYQIFF